MAHADLTTGLLTKPVRFSYWFILIALVLIGWLHLGGAFVASLFAYLALTRLNFVRRGGKWLSVVLFLILLAAIVYALSCVIRQIAQSLPEIADNAIPTFIDWAKKHDVELPFTDYDSLRDAALDWVKGQAHYLGSAVK